MKNKKLQSINPKKNVIIAEYEKLSDEELGEKIEISHKAFNNWKRTSFEHRAELLNKVADILLKRKAEFAQLMHDEMGKLLAEGESEIEKCAAVCKYYAENSAEILQDKNIDSGDNKTFITYQPQGAIFAIMPWNFPFWQVLRFAAPNLMAGNVCLLKHAENVVGCGVVVEQIFKEAGFEQGCFTALMIDKDSSEEVIKNDYVRGVTLTGSGKAGKAVAQIAAKYLKKSVLELGGSDPYIILKDADIDLAAEICAKSRLLNAGQTCISAKRFIVDKSVLQEFTEKFKQQMQAAKITYMARKDLQETLHEQVEKSIKQGAKLILGGEQGEGTYYPPTILTEVKPKMVAFDEELFGAVAAIIVAEDEKEAIKLANQTNYGLGAAVFSKDVEHATKIAREEIDSGLCAVNSFVQSAPELPFGGVKQSGYGRELGEFGLCEFVNVKTVNIGA